MNAKFNLPDFIMGQPVYSIFHDWMSSNPEILLPNTEIACVYGNFPGCIWNGGGMNFGSQYTRANIQEVINFYNYVLHIPLRFTFTNPLVDERHLNDVYGNIIAECGHNGMNEILTSSIVLEKYLREKYPNYKYGKSIIATREEPFDLSDKYFLTVMRRRMNNNWDFLETIPVELRHKVEFLCTDPCPDNCPRLYTHYRDFARAQLELNPNPDCECSMQHVKGPFQYKYLKSLETHISRKLINEEYLPRGFSQFKISGRGSALGAIMGITEYMIKPEYVPDAYATFALEASRANCLA